MGSNPFISIMNLFNSLPLYFLKYKHNSFLLILSISRGWGICKCLTTSIVLDSSLSHFVFSKAHRYFLYNMCVGFYKNYFYFLKLKGMGFRVLGHSKGLIFKLGCSHKLLFLKKIDIVFFYLARLIFTIKGRCVLTLKNILSTILSFKKKNSYKRKGIFYKGVITKVKLTSKKSKF